MMDHTQRRITVLHAIHNDTDCKQVIDLIDGLILIFHLFVNTEEMFDTTIYFCLNAGRTDMLADLINDRLDIFLAHALTHGNLIHQIIIHFRFQIFEREIIQLHLNLGNTEPLGDRRIDIHRFPCDALLFLRRHMLECPHVVQSVRQLDHDDADVLCHGKKHLAQILRLHLQLIDVAALSSGKLQLLQLRNAIHEEFHVRSEFSADFFRRQDRILHIIMEESCHDCLLIQFQICQNDRNAQRMNNIGLTRLSHLSLVSLIGYLVCFLDQRNVIGRMIFFNARN